MYKPYLLAWQDIYKDALSAIHVSVVTNIDLTGCNVHSEEIIIDNETLTSFPKASKVKNIRKEYPTLIDEYNL